MKHPKRNPGGFLFGSFVCWKCCQGSANMPLSLFKGSFLQRSVPQIKFDTLSEVELSIEIDFANRACWKSST